MPNEKARMRDYLMRGSRDQINLHPNDFTVAGSQKGTIWLPATVKSLG